MNSYMHFSTCRFFAFMTIKPFGKELDCFRESIIPMTHAVSVMKEGRLYVMSVPHKIPGRFKAGGYTT